MKRYHLLFLLCFIGWMPTLKADEIVREFSTRSGLTLSMDANIGVGISVSGWNQEKVYVKITSGARTAEFDAQFIQGDKGLEIRLKQGDTRNNWKGENLTCEIRVPTRYNVSVDIMGGNIALSDIEGVFTGKTMGGSLQLANLRGELDLKTMGGNIEVAHSDLEGKVHTMGGNILFKEVTGGVDGKTMGGQVMYENSKSPARSGTTASEVKISTMGGEIKVADAPAGASVKTYGGDITIDYAGDHVEATTYGGDIAIRETGSGKNRIVIKTVNGNVILKTE